MGLKVWIELVVSLIIGVIGLISTMGVAGFVLGVKIPLFVPNTIDETNSPRLINDPLWNNFLLFVGFAVQHSGMLRGPVKYILSLILSDNNRKIFYVLVTSIYVRFVFYHFWAPMPYPLWDIQHPHIKGLLHGVAALSFTMILLAQVNIDPLSLVGVRANVDQILNRKVEKDFVSTGLYKLVRHPMYTFMMMGLWVTPTMTVGHLLVAVVFSLYILFAVAYFEEPELIRAFGARYEAYMRNTPRYLPNLTATAGHGSKN